LAQLKRAVGFVCLLLGACSVQQPSGNAPAGEGLPPEVKSLPPAERDAATLPLASALPVPAPVPEVLSSLDEYKRAVALRIAQANAQHLFEGAPPPLLRSVVVLSIGIDDEGHPARVQVLRGNGHRSLEQAAMQSLQAAAPLPLPGRLAGQRRLLEFNETWLFRDDGRFQLRTLAEAQSDGGL
jgi:protein TonB